MSQLNVTTLKHESAGVDNLVLDSSGNTIMPYGSSLAFNSPTNQYISADANNLYLGTGNLYRIKVDTAGRVTMPYQPHARVSRNTGNVSGNTVVVFNFADENVAGMYNTSNGRFTAPVTGRYLFAHGLFSTNNAAAWLAWRVNGVNIATTYADVTSYDSVAGSIVLTMNAGDYADLYVNGSGYAIYGGDRSQCWATFTLLG